MTMSLKDKIEGNELDLSLNQLVDVPVKELAAATKATNLDLSCNLIQSLPDTFSSLKHLVKIDLSKNQLTELPDNFGNLINLHELDLYANQIVTLPLSFCRLKNLRWLDLKGNPLNAELKTIAGDCLDSKQCQSCAKSVVSFMQSIESSIEQDKQRRLKEEREKEALRQAKAEKELEEQRKKKKSEKEKRKAELKAKRDKELLIQSLKEKIIIDKNYDEIVPEVKPQKKMPTKNDGFHWSRVVLLVFAIPLLVAASVIGFGILRGHSLQDMSMEELQMLARESAMEFQEVTAVWWNAFFVPYMIGLKASILDGIHSAMVYVTDFVQRLDLSSFK